MSHTYNFQSRLYGFPSEMDFSPLLSESYSRRKRLDRDSETCVQKTLLTWNIIQKSHHLLCHLLVHGPLSKRRGS